MRPILYLILLVCVSCNSQNEKDVDWSIFQITGSKKVETVFLGSKSKIDWPVFDQKALALDEKEIIIEGFYQCLESTNLETLSSEKICLLTISKKYTIEVCGIPQFRQNEFIRIKQELSVPQGKKIRVKGILHINQDGKSESLISLENVVVI